MGSKANAAAQRQRGHLIVFEGPEDARRARIAAATADVLKRARIKHRLLSGYGNGHGSLGRHIADLCRDPKALGVSAFSDGAKNALHMTARIDVMERLILPSLQAGEHVLLEDGRWAAASASYGDGDVFDVLIDAERSLWRKHPAVLFVVGQGGAPIREGETFWSRVLRNRQAPGRGKAESCRSIVRLDGRSPPGAAIDTVLSTLAVHKIIKKPATQVLGDKRTAKSGQLSIEFGADSGAVRRGASAATACASRLSRATPTVVFDTYWRFASERQAVFFRRSGGIKPPWTCDPILTAHKFTNAYRASDRVSQFLIKNVIYGPGLPRSVDEVCFRIILFKLFNKIETWRLLEDQLGAVVHEEYSYERYDEILSRALGDGRRIYSAAYIMPPGGSAFGQKAKHQNHLRLLELMMQKELPAKLAGMRRMQDAFELLRSFPTIGNFLAYQLVTDINYSTVTDFSEMEFVMPGPGALDGIRKCFSSLGDLSEPDIIRMMVDTQNDEFDRLGLNFQSLFGRPLQLIDCQNLFCEVDKYSRVAHPEFVGRTGRSRIKQKFVPVPEPIGFWYPPKWDLNNTIAASFAVEKGGNIRRMQASPPKPIEHGSVR
jgi:hypothetical protein